MLGVAAEVDDDGAAAVPSTTRPDQARPPAPVPDDVELPARPLAVNPKRRPDQRLLNDSERRKMFGEAKRCGWEIDALKAMVYEKFGISTTKNLRAGDLDAVLTLIRRKPQANESSTTRVVKEREPGEDDIAF